MVKKSRKIFKKRRHSRTKKNIKKQKSQKGGFNDTDFLRCYENNLANIMRAVEEYSGKHAIDHSLSALFIENQLSDVRKQAASDLVENTIYITLAETLQIIEALILKLYGMVEIISADNIYIYSGVENKSSYFLAVLALYYIKKHSFKEPIFIKDLNLNVFDTIGDAPLIMLDDAAYSASQLSKLVNNIYYNRVIKQKLNPPNIFIVLLALNDFSKNKLSKVPTEMSGKNILKYTNSPFKLIYLDDRLYQPIILKIGIERYFYINFFFSLYTQSQPYISLYFDHKLADDASTYKKPLLYGPIVPSNYNVERVIEQTQLYSHMQYYFISYDMGDDEYEKLLSKFNKENKTTITGSKVNVKNIRDILDFLLNKLKATDICKETVETISFYPFINNCKENHTLIDNISDNNIINYEYLLFMVPEYCSGEPGITKGCSVPTDMIPENADIPENVAISNKINSIICPYTWYKKGLLEMKCISKTS